MPRHRSSIGAALRYLQALGIFFAQPLRISRSVKHAPAIHHDRLSGHEIAVG
jgi:hypothetical protein